MTKTIGVGDRFFLTLFVITSAALSAISMAHIVSSLLGGNCLPAWVLPLLSFTDALVDWLFILVENAFSYIARIAKNIFEIDVDFNANGKYHFALFMVYVSNDAFNAKQGDWEGKEITFLWRIAIGVLLASLIGGFAGVVYQGQTLTALGVGAVFVAGLFAYRVFYAYRFVAELASENAKGKNHDLDLWLRNKLSIAAWVLGIGVAILALNSLFKGPAWLPIILVVGALTVFHLTLAIINTNQRRNRSTAWLNDLSRQGNFKLAQAMAPGVASALLLTIYQQCSG